MRLPAIVLLILLGFSTTPAQLKQVVEDKGTFGLHVVDDRIVNHKYLER